VFEDFETWRIAFYIISYFVECLIGYWGLIFYYKEDKWDIKSIFFVVLTFIMMISVITVLVSSPRINLMSGFVLMLLWGTAGYGSIIIYFVKKKNKKS